MSVAILAQDRSHFGSCFLKFVLLIAMVLYLNGLGGGYGGAAYAGRHYSQFAQTNVDGASRSQVRRRQRQHTLACYKAGALHRAGHRLEVAVFNELVSSDEAEVLLSSVATHRADCESLQTQIHFAAISNISAFQNGHKSKRTCKTHRGLHQQANFVKHTGLPKQDLPPVPPPPRLLTCEEVETQLLGGIVPFSGKSWNLNINAPIFAPGGIEWNGASQLVENDISCDIPGTFTATENVCKFCGLWTPEAPADELCFGCGLGALDGGPEAEDLVQTVPLAHVDCPAYDLFSDDGVISIDGSDDDEGGVCSNTPINYTTFDEWSAKYVQTFHWTYNLPGSVLDSLLDADPHVFDSVHPNQQHRDIVEAYYTESVAIRPTGASTHINHGPLQDAEVDVPGSVGDQLQKVSGELEFMLDGRTEDSGAALRLQGDGFVGRNFPWRSKWANLRIASIDSVMQLFIWMWLACAWMVKSLQQLSRHLASLCSYMYANMEGLSGSFFKTLSPEQQANACNIDQQRAVRNILRDRGVNQNGVPHIGPLPLASNAHEQRRTRSKLQQQAQLHKRTIGKGH